MLYIFIDTFAKNWVVWCSNKIHSCYTRWEAACKFIFGECRRDIFQSKARALPPKLAASTNGRAGSFSKFLALRGK